MTHEPVAFTVAWLRTALPSQLVPTVTSMLDPRDPLPAIIVPRHTGGPLNDPSGVDRVYDWTMTVYVHAGRTGPGNDLPDSQTVWAVTSAIVNACRDNVDSKFRTDGVELVNAVVVTLSRGQDENGNGRATLTLILRTRE
jgi:hypothetical protein